jgi:hypothetical protein
MNPHLKGFEMKISIKIHRQPPEAKFWRKTSLVTSTSARHRVILLGKLITITIFRYKKGGFIKN